MFHLPAHWFLVTMFTLFTVSYLWPLDITDTPGAVDLEQCPAGSTGKTAIDNLRAINTLQRAWTTVFVASTAITLLIAFEIWAVGMLQQPQAVLLRHDRRHG